MKKMLPAIALVLATLQALAVAPSPVIVKGLKKTADSHRSSNTQGRHQVTHTSKDIFYQFDLTTSSPAVPASIVAKWVVLTEDYKGRPHVGTKGEKEIELPKNKTVSIETDDFNLESRQVRVVGRHKSIGSGEDEEKVLGYGVRIFDGNGNLISEEYNPDNETRALADAFDGKLKDVDADINPKRK